MFNPFKKTATTRLIFFVTVDMLVIALSVWLSFLIRFDGHLPAQYSSFIFTMIGLAIVFVIPIFYLQKLYFFSLSYASTSEIISLFRATSASFVFLAIAIYLSKDFSGFKDFPRSTIFVSYGLVFILCAGVRFSKKIYLLLFQSNITANKEKTLIVGAGDAGEQILRSMLSLAASPYVPVGFVDDSKMKQGIKIHGVKVLGKLSQIPEIVRHEGIKQLIVAIPSAGNKVIRQVVELGRSAGLRKIKMAPPIHEIISGKVSFKNLKNVDAEDLLGRSAIDLDKKQIDQFIKNNVVLITGAAGSIGSELARQVAKFKPSLLVCLDQDETGIFNISKELKHSFSELCLQSLVADVNDAEKMGMVFKEHRPDIVFHAAAYKHVPLMEAQPEEAVKNNVFGTEVLAKASVEHHVGTFIFISTDKAVNPTSVMGATKRLGEMICQAYNVKNQTKFISVRFGNVLDSRGSVIPTFREQIKRGGPVEVTHRDMQRYFMLTSEACLLVMQAAAMGRGGG